MHFLLHFTNFTPTPKVSNYHWRFWCPDRLNEMKWEITLYGLYTIDLQEKLSLSWVFSVEYFMKASYVFSSGIKAYSHKIISLSIQSPHIFPGDSRNAGKTFALILYETGDIYMSFPAKVQPEILKYIVAYQASGASRREKKNWPTRRGTGCSCHTPCQTSNVHFTLFF